MTRDIMKEIENKYKEYLNYRSSKRLIGELFNLFIDLRKILINQKIIVNDDEDIDLYKPNFLTKKTIFTVTYRKKAKGILGLFDTPEIYFSIKEKETLKIYSLTQKTCNLIAF